MVAPCRLASLHAPVKARLQERAGEPEGVHWTTCVQSHARPTASARRHERRWHRRQRRVWRRSWRSARLHDGRSGLRGPRARLGPRARPLKRKRGAWSARVSIPRIPESRRRLQAHGFRSRRSLDETSATTPKRQKRDGVGIAKPRAWIDDVVRRAQPRTRRLRSAWESRPRLAEDETVAIRVGKQAALSRGRGGRNPRGKAGRHSDLRSVEGETRARKAHRNAVVQTFVFSRNQTATRS